MKTRTSKSTFDIAVVIAALAAVLLFVPTVLRADSIDPVDPLGGPCIGTDSVSCPSKQDNAFADNCGGGQIVLGCPVTKVLTGVGTSNCCYHVTSTNTSHLKACHWASYVCRATCQYVSSCPTNPFTKTKPDPEVRYFDFNPQTTGSGCLLIGSWPGTACAEPTQPMPSPIRGLN